MRNTLVLAVSAVAQIRIIIAGSLATRKGCGSSWRWFPEQSRAGMKLAKLAKIGGAPNFRKTQPSTELNATTRFRAPAKKGTFVRLVLHLGNIIFKLAKVELKKFLFYMVMVTQIATFSSSGISDMHQSTQAR